MEVVRNRGMMVNKQITVGSNSNEKVSFFFSILKLFFDKSKFYSQKNGTTAIEEL